MYTIEEWMNQKIMLRCRLNRHKQLLTRCIQVWNWNILWQGQGWWWWFIHASRVHNNILIDDFVFFSRGWRHQRKSPSFCFPQINFSFFHPLNIFITSWTFPHELGRLKANPSNRYFFYDVSRRQANETTTIRHGQVLFFFSLPYLCIILIYWPWRLLLLSPS